MKLTCKEASRLLSLGLDRELSLGQRTSLRLHLALCDTCNKLKAQFEFLRRALSTYSGAGEDADQDRSKKE
jgi:hypothetical protein